MLAFQCLDWRVSAVMLCCCGCPALLMLTYFPIGCFVCNEDDTHEKLIRLSSLTGVSGSNLKFMITISTDHFYFHSRSSISTAKLSAARWPLQ